MGDFSAVTISSEIISIPPDVRLALYGQYQCKDLPDDEKLSCCVDGTIETDGRFVRSDHRGRFWVPNFSWWLRLVPEFGGDDLYVEFRSGRAVKFQLSDKKYKGQQSDDATLDWVPVD